MYVSVDIGLSCRGSDLFYDLLMACHRPSLPASLARHRIVELVQQVSSCSNGIDDAFCLARARASNAGVAPVAVAANVTRRAWCMDGAVSRRVIEMNFPVIQPSVHPYHQICASYTTATTHRLGLTQTDSNTQIFN
jgi:hypothetical protein